MVLTKAEKTTKFILEQVAPIFNKKGYAGTAMSDIEQATGLTKGAIYGNFKNKDHLASACFDQNVKMLQRGVHLALSISGECYDKLYALVDFYEAHFDEVAAMGGCPLLNTATESDDTLPFLKSKVRERITSWKKELNAVLNQGKSEGAIYPTVDVDRFSTSFIAMIEGGIMLAKAMDDKVYFEHAMKGIDRMIENELKIKGLQKEQ